LKAFESYVILLLMTVSGRKGGKKLCRSHVHVYFCDFLYFDSGLYEEIGN